MKSNTLSTHSHIHYNKTNDFFMYSNTNNLGEDFLKNNHTSFKEIKKELLNILNSEKNIFNKIKQLLDKWISLLLQKNKNIQIQEFKSNNEYYHSDKTYKMNIGDHSFFIKTYDSKKSYGDFNVFKEALLLDNINFQLKEDVKKAIQKKYNIIVKALEPIYSISKDGEGLNIYPFLEGFEPLNTIIKEDVKYSIYKKELFLFPEHNINQEKKKIIQTLNIIYNHLDQYTQENVSDIFDTRNILFKKLDNKLYLYLTDPCLRDNRISNQDFYKKFL